MVGKRPRAHREARSRDRAREIDHRGPRARGSRRCPGFAARARRRARAGVDALPGRRRGARPAARRAPSRRPRRRRRGRRRRRWSQALGGERDVHDRFETATVELARRAGRRRPRPRRDLPAPGRAARGRARPTSPRTCARRDFTVNAIAVPLAEPGRADRPARRARRPAGRAAAGAARPARSPTTRPGRCAPRATRPGSGSSSSRGTLELLRGADLAHRLRATGSRPSCAGSPPSRRPARGFELLAEWGLLELAAGRRRADRPSSAGLLAEPPWDDVAARRRRRCSPRSRRPAATRRASWPRLRAGVGPRRRSLPARGHAGVELALARALGAEWLDDYVGEWRECGSRSPATT